ncbi:uncharacterized protein LOC126576167 [Anopheles aquasalis]|uniref:uncharacterized protein LOC126576167 n=1 Tax=Anopheles aquasalis TaxID=42839 RepID=UPI00215B4C84|nr:uncharacterized protein LOC126576167 [Anopheles aquasalis]
MAAIATPLCAQVFLLIVIQNIKFSYGSLYATTADLDERLSEAFLPNVREAIDDCHLRYYRLGEGPEPKPAFGRPAYLREFAHMAAVGWTGSDGKIRWDCGGSLIWENYVLTAAHCVADDDNIPPDVVRLGDINLYDDTDDQYAQQLKIVEIVRHPEHRFSSRYHDLALLRLEKNVTLHDTVAPGCLWNDEKEIPFPTMEATGWGATGFGEQSTPILLKVSLGVVKSEECNKYYKVGDRGLKQGLMNYQLCAGDVKMDTCPGDSGGPLQMKLLHNGKMTPFIVAVTSFGSVCGQSNPGVYMKVAPYIPWISAELAKRGEIIRDWSFKPYACALRYVYLREYEDDVVVSKSGGFENLDSSKAHMSIFDSTQTVSIHWPAGSPSVPSNCNGVVIDEDTIVTLARCAIAGRIQPSHIMLRNTRNDIVRVHRHPGYKPNSFYNDIAILKVKDRFTFSQDFVPACIWSAYNLPDPQFYVTGHGRIDLNKFDSYSNAQLEINPTIVQLSPRANIVINDTCTLPEEYSNGLSRGVTTEHLCFRNKPFLVPESCEMLYGAPLRRNIWRLGRHFEHIYALNLLGKDCGFGRAALGTRLGYHSEWLKSVLLPNYRDESDSVQFFNTDLNDFDQCTGADGNTGLCVNVNRCPKIRYDVQAKRNVQFCNGGTIVCCPYDNIRNETSTSMSASELDDCESRYKQFHEMYEPYQSDRIDHFYHTVYFGWKTKDGTTEWICSGTLITRSVVITSAYCLLADGDLPILVNVAEGNPNATWSRPNPVGIKEVIIHPGYNATTLQYDIGLVRLVQPIVPTARKYPICLWQNETHTPLVLYRMVDNDDYVSRFELNFPKYNSDCRQDLRHLGRRELQSNDLCTDVDGIPGRSISGDPLIWYHRNPNDNSSTQYLVGIISSALSAQRLGIHVRISSYIGWIKSIQLSVVIPLLFFLLFFSGKTIKAQPQGYFGLHSNINEHYKSNIKPVGTKLFAVSLLIISYSGYGELDAIESGLHEDLSEAFLPNIREAIDDCHLRYYKLGEGPEPKPVFGRPAYLREFAHMAAIGWTGSDGKIRWDCGGSLIWENYVLTAAHCVADDDNIPPDVVRLGDINLYDDTDDQYAQQLKIVEIVRHPEHRFSSRYHDLALLRLEKNVTLHDTVAPGCLWNDEKEIPFPTMEATGWGATGFGEQSTPILLKVSLGVVKSEECNKHYKVGDRKLKQGLMNYHLCAGDVKMDTCPGDSGGPLQMKLLHNGKMTPFVVAVTSFGSICGQSIPGVYMKVAPYIPWISAELAKRGEIIRDWSFKPYACALRYVRLREYEDEIVTKVSGGMEGVNPGNAHMNIINSTQTVSIHWPAGSPSVPSNCNGVVIDEDTIVTLARCAIAGRNQPSHIMLRNTRNDIVRVHRHPAYKSNSFYNDIAILKLKDRFIFSKLEDFVPACIWSAYKLPKPQFYVTGHGRIDLNIFDYDFAPKLKIDPTIVQLSPRANIVINDTCTLPEEYSNGLSRGVTTEHLCFRNKPFLVPESCEMLYGAPLRRNIWRLGRHFEHIYALNLLGKDCGFGRAALGTRLGYHSEWLKSVLLPNYREKMDSVPLLNKKLGNLAHCTGTDGSTGLCVNINRCPKVRYDVQAHRKIQFCNGKDVVCCPYDNIRNETSTSMAASELDDCESRYKQFHEMYESYQPDRIDHFYHTVYLGWKTKDGSTEWICSGTLITRSIVVSSAYCLMANGNFPTLVNVAEGNPNATWSRPKPVGIKEVIIHPGYNATTLQYDIGLVRLVQPIVPTARKYPICLWQNETHTPLVLYRMVADDGELNTLSSTETMCNFELNFPKYNSDCSQELRQLGRRDLQSNELCTDIDGTPQRSISGGPLVWYHRNPQDNSTTQYLLGIVISDVPAKELGIHVRISSFIGWIKSIV